MLYLGHFYAFFCASFSISDTAKNLGGEPSEPGVSGWQQKWQQSLWWPLVRCYLSTWCWDKTKHFKMKSKKRNGIHWAYLLLIMPFTVKEYWETPYKLVNIITFQLPIQSFAPKVFVRSCSCFRNAQTRACKMWKHAVLRRHTRCTSI